MSALSASRCSAWIARGVQSAERQRLAAIPTISPIAPVVFMTLTAPRASWVTLMSRPAMKRFETLRL